MLAQAPGRRGRRAKAPTEEYLRGRRGWSRRATPRPMSCGPGQPGPTWHGPVVLRRVPPTPPGALRTTLRPAAPSDSSHPAGLIRRYAPGRNRTCDTRFRKPSCDRLEQRREGGSRQGGVARHRLPHRVLARTSTWAMIGRGRPLREQRRGLSRKARGESRRICPQHRACLKASYLILHRSSCRTISGTPAHGTQWTSDYVKHCSEDSGELIDWARTRTGGTPNACLLCAPPMA